MMTVIFIFLVVFLLVFTIFPFGIDGIKEAKDMKNNIHNDHFEIEAETEKGTPISNIAVSYQGGYALLEFDNMSAMDMTLFDDRINLEEDAITISSYKLYHTINLEDIVDISVKTEEELRKNVTLSRVAVFGLFAFTDTLKKKKVEITRYIVIRTKEQGFDNVLIVKSLGSSSSMFVKSVREQLMKISKKTF